MIYEPPYYKYISHTDKGSYVDPRDHSLSGDHKECQWITPRSFWYEWSFGSLSCLYDPISDWSLCMSDPLHLDMIPLCMSEIYFWFLLCKSDPFVWYMYFMSNPMDPHMIPSVCEISLVYISSLSLYEWSLESTCDSLCMNDQLDT